jgi:hypothetical protein
LRSKTLTVSLIIAVPAATIITWMLTNKK